jgi:hypothetical protein
MDKLNNEVVAIILDFLPDPADLGRLACCSRRLRHLATPLRFTITATIPRPVDHHVLEEPNVDFFNFFNDGGTVPHTMFAECVADDRNHSAGHVLKQHETLRLDQPYHFWIYDKMGRYRCYLSRAYLSDDSFRLVFLQGGSNKDEPVQTWHFANSIAGPDIRDDGPAGPIEAKKRRLNGTGSKASGDQQEVVSANRPIALYNSAALEQPHNGPPDHKTTYGLQYDHWNRTFWLPKDPSAASPGDEPPQAAPIISISFQHEVATDDNPSATIVPAATHAVPVLPQHLINHTFIFVYEPNAFADGVSPTAAMFGVPAATTVRFQAKVIDSHLVVTADALQFPLVVPIFQTDDFLVDSGLFTPRQVLRGFFRQHSARWEVIRYYFAVAADGDNHVSVQDATRTWPKQHVEHAHVVKDGCFYVEVKDVSLERRAHTVPAAAVGYWHAVFIG